MTDQGFQIVLFWAKAASPWPVFRLAGVAFVFVALCWGVRCGLVCAFARGPCWQLPHTPVPPVTSSVTTHRLWGLLRAALEGLRTDVE